MKPGTAVTTRSKGASQLLYFAVVGEVGLYGLHLVVAEADLRQVGGTQVEGGDSKMISEVKGNGAADHSAPSTAIVMVEF